MLRYGGDFEMREALERELVAGGHRAYRWRARARPSARVAVIPHARVTLPAFETADAVL